MIRIAIALALITTPTYAQQMAQPVPIEQSREQFKRDCRLHSPQGEKRAAWLASCRREAP